MVVETFLFFSNNFFICIKINLVEQIEGIISRASAARGGGSALYDSGDMDRDSISDGGAKATTTTAWNITQQNGTEENGVLQRSNKKLSWSNGGPGPITVNGKVSFT